MQMFVRFMWVPAHKEVVENEMADRLAKQSQKQERGLEIALSKSEVKATIKTQIESVAAAMGGRAKGKTPVSSSNEGREG